MNLLELNLFVTKHPAKHLSNEKFYKTETTTVQIKRMTELISLPCIQRAGLCAAWVFEAVSAPATM